VTRERLVTRLLLAASLAGLVGLAALAAGGGWQPRVSPIAFLSLLAVELTLLDRALVSGSAAARAWRVALFLVPLAVAVALRAWRALAARDVLEWDETYYLSLAVTAADGRGLYPYIFGYAPMPILGGVGYASYLYALAVMLAGPTILALRVVSLLASLAALACLWLLVRLWYGAGAAWIAAALVSALQLFALSNSARPDSLALAYAAGGLMFWAVARERRRPGWHFAAGFVFGLGLQVHLDTVVTAVACGLAYIVAWLATTIRERRVAVPTSALLYAAGWSLGLALFVASNILPDPDAFYRTTVLIRVDATSWYSGGTSSVAGSFLDPRILLAKEQARYGLLLGSLPWFETALLALGVLALLVRRQPIDRVVFTLAAGVLVLASIVLNNASPLYFVHVTPALLVPLAPLFTHGTSGRGRVAVDDVSPLSCLAFAIAVSALVAVNPARAALNLPSEPGDAEAAFAHRVRSLAGRACMVAGDADLYVRFFADYPYFVSTRPTEVSYAMLYYGERDEAAYWTRKAPDVVFAEGTLSDGLSSYVVARGMAQAYDGIWVAPGGCAPGAQSR
jgi:hypothetical protein